MKEQTHEVSETQIGKELPGWDRVRCSECDDVVAYISPEVKVHGDTLPVFCFPCASNLAVKDN